MTWFVWIWRNSQTLLEWKGTFGGLSSFRGFGIFESHSREFRGDQIRESSNPNWAIRSDQLCKMYVSQHNVEDAEPRAVEYIYKY